MFDGKLMVGGQRLAKNQLARLSEQAELELSTSSGARILFLAGRPINEPIVQYGPFVMNSREEIEQALRDFCDGVFTG